MEEKNTVVIKPEGKFDHIADSAAGTCQAPRRAGQNRKSWWLSGTRNDGMAGGAA